ncbi:MAG: LLM class F420-dependent oxidoreductase [Gammaproteobacteria bacterium]|nr:LLM class F420-dependent oxidoreductase [Gammaproteobacteria bacterium]
MAMEMEQRGYESLWLPEHTHIPLYHATPYPGGIDLPKEYYHVIDPFVGLAAAAQATKNLKLATGICLVAQRDPIHLAKTISTLDQLSNGRFIFGVGNGWNHEEMENHGVSPAVRSKLLAERISVLKKIWTEEKIEFRGEFHNYEPFACWPKPVQTPHPPIVVGGGMPHGARRAITYGNGWLPFDAQIGSIEEEVKKFRDMADGEGRNPNDLPISLVVSTRDRCKLELYRECGIHRVVFLVQTANRDVVLSELDEISELMNSIV